MRIRANVRRVEHRACATRSRSGRSGGLQGRVPLDGCRRHAWQQHGTRDYFFGASAHFYYVGSMMPGSTAAGPTSGSAGKVESPSPGENYVFLALTLHQFTDQLINGVTLGMLYILVALGLNIILGLMGVINYSHGSFFMLGAYAAYSLNSVAVFGRASYSPRSRSASLECCSSRRRFV